MEFVCPYSMSHPERSSSFATRGCYEVEGPLPTRCTVSFLSQNIRSAANEERQGSFDSPHLFASEEVASI